MQQYLISDSVILPVRHSAPVCSVRSFIAVNYFSHGIILRSFLKCPVLQFYAKTGKCKFGASCKFNHPKDIKFNHPKDSKMSPLIAKETIYTATADAAAHIGAADDSVPAKTHAPTAPAEAHNAKGLPIRPVCVYEMVFFFS